MRNPAFNIISFNLLLTALLIFQAKAEEINKYDSVIVSLKENLSYTKRPNKLMYRGGILRFKKIENNAYLIPLDEYENKEKQIKELAQSGLFDLIEPDYKLTLDKIYTKRDYNEINIIEQDKEITTNDTAFPYQYYLKQIKSTTAWLTTVGEGIPVAILDTGVDINHPDLAGKVPDGISIDALDQTDLIGHGTQVAGIIAANTNNYKGIAGIAWNAKIIPIRITNDDGEASISTVISALEKASENGAKIIQISLGTNQYSEFLEDAIKTAQSRGILIVSTVGNSGINEIRYPAAFNGVIGVGAVDRESKIEPYSTIGNHVTLVAPGSFIYTTSPDSNYTTVSGTSFAAPQVTGAATLVWSIAPHLSPEEVTEILIQSADELGEKGNDIVYGHGLLNIEAAVNIASKIAAGTSIATANE
jgi:subtilisin family serine protease